MEERPAAERRRLGVRATPLAPTSPPSPMSRLCTLSASRPASIELHSSARALGSAATSTKSLPKRAPASAGDMASATQPVRSSCFASTGSPSRSGLSTSPRLVPLSDDVRWVRRPTTTAGDSPRQTSGAVACGSRCCCSAVRWSTLPKLSKASIIRLSGSVNALCESLSASPLACLREDAREESSDCSARASLPCLTAEVKPSARFHAPSVWLIDLFRSSSNSCSCARCASHARTLFCELSTSRRSFCTSTK